MSAHAPAFPLAGGALGPLKAAAEAKGLDDFTSLWSGQAAALGRTTPAGAPIAAGTLTADVIRETLELLQRLRSA
jgi:nitronate monooxygenase